MQDEQDDRRIAQGLREGKTDAWQALYDAYAERVWRGIARLLGPSGTDVADVVQETMMAAARSAAGFHPERGTLWQWLWGIAHHQVALHWRKHEQRRRLSEAVALLAANHGHLLDCLETKEQSPLDASAAGELAVLVRAVVFALPIDYAMLLTARYLDDETVALIAVRERTTETAVRSKLARARQAFREAFSKHAGATAVLSKEADHES